MRVEILLSLTSFKSGISEFCTIIHETFFLRSLFVVEADSISKIVVCYVIFEREQFASDSGPTLFKMLYIIFSIDFSLIVLSGCHPSLFRGTVLLRFAIVLTALFRSFLGWLHRTSPKTSHVSLQFSSYGWNFGASSC